MRMAELNVGLGFGVKTFQAVFVFNTPEVLQRFVEDGWEFGADANAIAQRKDKGGGTSGGASVNDIDIYQITDTVLAIEATVGGTKYWKDDKLND
jgi:lipid-binding SYLF domain-containing protein